ncbi:DC-STAMP domain-containing protein 2 [Mizuhopecten yessoensis]|uniref:DC-STAMP domain-containing protein 2 n=2 Tax=Mizuhopecten yessoensis TaxID=6573 RepID=A0A210QHY7_MIZYE|nr:DC-STAMP domain-containing protein 2 [Mizuhopecten yessoensis]
MKKSKSAVGEKPPSRWQRIKENPDSFLYKLFLSGTREHRCLKAIFGILWGVATGGLFYALITFSFGYDYDISGWITIGITVMMSIGLAVSTHFRCVVMVMIPSICTGRGRVAVLATIFYILISGPVMNISDNANQVSNSMACTSELIYNQSQLLRKQLEEPIRQIARAIEDSLDDLQTIGQRFQKVIDPVTEQVEAVDRKIKEAASAVRDAAKKCTQGVNDVYRKCVDGINNAKRECEKQLEVLDKIADGVVDTANTVGDGVKGAIDTIGNVFGKRRRKRACYWSLPWQHRYQPLTTECSERRRHKRFASAVCRVLDISDVCVVVKPGSGLCSVLNLFQDVTDVALRETRDLIYTLTDFFEFGVNSNSDLYGKINSSQTAAQIMANVRADIQERTELIYKIIKIIKYILAFPFLFLFIRSALYVKKYRTKDHFDNKYISRRFKRYDDERKQQGKKAVLPLKKIEKRKYIDTRSKLLSPAELQMVKVGAVSVSLQFLITLAVIIADYVLFYVLTVMQQFGNINVSVTGDSNVSLGVVGSGFIAKMIGSLLAVLEVDTDFAVNFNLTQCLPDPQKPNVQTILVLSVLYFVAFVFIFTQAYGLRIRRKIAAYFYPTQEQERIKYLHEKIRLKRQSKLLWFSKNLKSRRKENSILSHVPFLIFLSDHMPGNCKCTPQRKTVCLGCKEEFTGVSEFHVCPTPGCDGVYCMECFMEMNKKCIVCTNTSKSVKRGVVSFSKGQQKY